jgi:hypothetical protein
MAKTREERERRKLPNATSEEERKRRIRANKKKWKEANPEAVRAAQKRHRESGYHTQYRKRPEHKERQKGYHTKYNYGLTIDQYRELAAAQGALCAICMTPPAGRYGLVVDHCHETGKVRGLLCQRCNTALGHARDNVLTLYAMVAYLQGHRSAAGAESTGE